MATFFCPIWMCPILRQIVPFDPRAICFSRSILTVYQSSTRKKSNFCRCEGRWQNEDLVNNKIVGARLKHRTATLRWHAIRHTTRGHYLCGWKCPEAKNESHMGLTIEKNINKRLQWTAQARSDPSKVTTLRGRADPGTNGRVMTSICPSI